VLNPFVVANTGPGFNITTGQDRNLDRQFNERPSFAAANADCSAQNIRCTRFGNFNLTPLPGETIIPRNFGQAPGSFVVNLRISRAFAFGVINRGNAAAAKPAATAGGGAAGDKKPVGGPGGPSLAAGGGGAGAKVAAIGPQGGGGALPSEKRYNVNVSINFQNLFNRVNLSTPVGNLASPSFGESLGLGGAFGGFGGGGGSTGAGNRRIYAQVRFNF
jgi:hypothetical protein